MSPVTRREALALPLAAAACTTVGTGQAEPSLAEDIARYVSFGIHRAGTVGERKTALWLRDRLAGLGYAARLQPFPIRTLLDPGGAIAIDGAEIELFPQWYPPADALGQTIAAPLVSLDDPAGPTSIRLVSKPAALSANWVPALDALVAQAQAKGARALIIAMNDPVSDLFVSNQHHLEPLPIPVAHVRRSDLSALLAKTGRAAKFRIAGSPTNTNALNVLGERSGTGRKIVISTPLTGWFTCGGERGSGIALWLALARHLAKQSHPVLLIGTGSHEIGHLGMEHALAHGAPAPDEVELWIHLGASLGATLHDEKYSYRSGQYLVGTDLTATPAREALLAALPIYVPGTAATLGEAGQVIGGGHRRFVGISGQFPGFHTPIDDGSAVDHAKLAQIERGLHALIAKLTA